MSRMRRNRTDSWIRNLISENNLSVKDLIWPIFVTSNKYSTEITTMPGIMRYNINGAVKATELAHSLGINAIALFPEIDKSLKNSLGDEATNENNLICKSIKAIQKAVPEIGIICDVALDPYTDHGHDGIIKNNYIDNDETIKVLCKQALVQAQSGCDIIAPSDMMDGRIREIRQTLDQHNFQNIKIMSYSAKFLSSLYSPFRDAIGSVKIQNKIDKSTYQMDYANSNEALREVAMDIEEGADMVMIKPGLPYLDIIYRVKSTFGFPTFAYQVSGEYSMIKQSVEAGIFDNDLTILETLLCFKRAGADGILTYFAAEAAKLLQN